MLGPMSPRRTDRAVAEAAPLEAAKAATGARGSGSQDPLVGELRRAGLLPLLVLHFLREEPSYGGRLMEQVGEVSGGLIAVNPNTMYPLLRELEARGLVAGEWEHPERRSGCSHSPATNPCASSSRSSGYIVFGLTAMRPPLTSPTCSMRRPP